MLYLVFARKWRPQGFDEIVGQEHVTTTLKNAIKLSRVAQAYLFVGPRGIGKTSTARIFAKALNCLKGASPAPCNKCTNCQEITAANSLDVIEIDGASNRGIDEIRVLRENVKLSPANARYKIYIIDEVHQISHDGFNALLKTLEEPPAHVKFIFATTQPNKIPATILSRCQRFDFKKIPTAQIVEKLKEIAKAEGINAADGVFFEIAKASDGSLRDAESILDQLNSFCEKKIGMEDVISVLGIIDEDLFLNLLELMAKKDSAGILKMVDKLSNDGKDLSLFLAGLIEHVRNLSLVRIDKSLGELLEVPKETLDKLAKQSAHFGSEELMYFFYVLSAAYDTAKRTGMVRFALEFALIKLVLREGMVPINEVLEKIKAPAAILPASAAPVPAAPAVSANVAQFWPELIKRVNAKKPFLASFLQEGEPVSLDGELLKVNFSRTYAFHKDILEKPENKKVIEEIASEITSGSLKLELKLVENTERKNNFRIHAAEEEAKKEQDPAIKDAMDVFNGSVIRSKREDA